MVDKTRCWSSWTKWARILFLVWDLRYNKARFDENCPPRWAALITAYNSSAIGRREVRPTKRVLTKICVFAVLFFFFFSPEAASLIPRIIENSNISVNISKGDNFKGNKTDTDEYINISSRER